MSRNSNAHLRYNILDYCFREKAFTFNELLEYVNSRMKDYDPEESVSKRTLREDLKVFRRKKNGFSAPLPEKLRVYKYINKKFSIAQRPLLDNELAVISLIFIRFIK